MTPSIVDRSVVPIDRLYQITICYRAAAYPRNAAITVTWNTS